MSEIQTDGIERDENGQCVIPNEGAGVVVQNIEAQTPDDLKQQIDNIEIKGRTECQCNFPSSEAINVLRVYNDAYKNRMDAFDKGFGDIFLGMHGWENDSMAFVLHCSDGVTLPLKLQMNVVTLKNKDRGEYSEYYICFELPPSNDSVDDSVIDIRKRLNDTMYIDENFAGTDLDMVA